MEAQQHISENNLDYIFSPDKVLLNGNEVLSYNVFLPTEIDDYQEISEAIRLLRSYQVANQLITVFCRGFGGCTMIGNDIINAMKSSVANVRVVVPANCYSMHSIIALSMAHNIEIEPGANFMLHQVGTSIPVSRLAHAQVDVGHTKQIDQQMGMHVRPYLTKEELVKYDHGIDVYVSGAEMTKRINRLAKLAQKAEKIEAKLLTKRKKGKQDDETTNLNDIA